MIPIKNFRQKKTFMAKSASTLPKNAEIIKNFRMPVVAMIAPSKKKKRK